MLTNILIILYKILKPTDADKFFNTATNIVMISANIIDVVAVLIVAQYYNKFAIVLYGVICSMLARVNRGEHYDTWLECLLSSVLIYTLYAVSSLTINNLAVDLILGLVLAVTMIDFKRVKG